MRASRIVGVALLLAACATTPSVQQTGATIEAAFEVPGVPKERIFDVTRAWVTNDLRAQAKGIEAENRAQGKLVAFATAPYPCAGDECERKHGWEVPFKMRVDIKDAGFTVTFTNVRLTWPEYSYRPAYDGPVQPYGDWQLIKAYLQDLAGQLQRAVVGNRASTFPPPHAGEGVSWESLI